MEIDEAVEVVERLMRSRPRLRIAAVSGPGEPLYNDSTLSLFEELRFRHPHLRFCLSTNGVLLDRFAASLARLGVETVTVSMHALSSEVAERVYEWVRLDEHRMTERFGSLIVERQLSGIREAVRHGMHVRVNTVFIPGLNDTEPVRLAEAIAKAGAELQNIIPLVPMGAAAHIRPPTRTELRRARKEASKYVPQFTHCRQCRSDVVGIPGADEPL